MPTSLSLLQLVTHNQQNVQTVLSCPQKTKANHQRPKLSLSSRPLAAVERPNTAPCASFPAPQSVDMPARPFTSDHNTCPIPSFTSQYMRQSLGMELQQSEYHLPPSNSPRTTPDKTLSSDRCVGYIIVTKWSLPMHSALHSDEQEVEAASQYVCQ